MGFNKSGQSNDSVAVDIVQKINSLSDELVSAITQNDGLNKYRFDNAIAEREKHVHAAKQKYIQIAKEYDVVSENLETAKKRSSQIRNEFQKIMFNNEVLNKKKESVKEKYDRAHEFQLANEIRLKLTLYKKLTGVYFDFGTPENNLSGYVAIKGEAFGKSGLVPFLFENYNPDEVPCLWNQIGEALEETAANKTKMSK